MAGPYCGSVTAGRVRSRLAGRDGGLAPVGGRAIETRGPTYGPTYGRASLAADGVIGHSGRTARTCRRGIVPAGRRTRGPARGPAGRRTRRRTGGRSRHGDPARCRSCHRDVAT
ncbi:hypothetical protein GCM10029978_000270 [Actinoallomurus acanthiterrae]